MDKSIDPAGSQMTESDLDLLMQKSSRGDDRAFRELYDAAAPRIMAIAYRMLNDHHQAEDVVQQTMLAAWHSAGNFDPARSHATTWLTSIARYRSLDLIRSNVRQRNVFEEGHQDILRVLGHDQPVTDSSPLPSETVNRLAECLSEISRDEAGCIQLAFLDGLTFSEIAGRLEKSIGTVKSWVRRGIQKLRECVER